MKKPSQRLETVLKIAKLRQRLASEVLAENISVADNHQKQLNQLEAFKRDYDQQFSANDSLVTAVQLHNYQQFYTNLENAVEVQQERLVLSKEQLEQSRSVWRQHYLREKNMKTLIDKKHQLEEKELESKLQREQDDRYIIKNKE